ncbi:MAG: DUF1566 domain-containing protein, partial [Treponema sp.]|nr:DUF1566 domain-containing protein [Treponema sp.]
TCNRCTETDGTQPYPILALGATGPAGGKIIYVAPAGFTVTSTTPAFTTYTAYYIEAAPTDAGYMRWSTQSSSPYPDVAGTLLTIGSGRNNTALIIAAEQTAHPSNAYIYAALACKNYTSSGFESFNDWFLPSQDELNQLYLRRADFSITTGWFWSSSQSSFIFAWFQVFGNGNQTVSDKGANSDVRAIRAF